MACACCRFKDQLHVHGITPVYHLGVEKKNDSARSIYRRKSNKWDAASDILKGQGRLCMLKQFKRQKRQYHKRNEHYWDKQITESRKKRQKLGK